MDLNLEKYLISPAVPYTYFINGANNLIKPSYWKEINQSKSTKYKLYGVVNHFGSL
jgi:hypothetical protein